MVNILFWEIGRHFGYKDKLSLLNFLDQFKGVQVLPHFTGGNTHYL